MRILLISANREPFPESVFPVGLMYVAHGLQMAGAQVLTFDMRHQTAISSLQKVLLEFRPDHIGISLRNVDNASYPAVRFYLPSYQALMQSVRTLCEAPIILGGSAFSLFPEEITKHLGADGGVQGEGEKAAGLFQNHSGGQIVSMGLLNIDEVAFPKNIKEIFPGFHRYETIGLQSARGCPNHCIYCTYPSLEGRQHRARSPESVVGEITMFYKDFGIREFFIVDSLFNADEGHMVQVLEDIARMSLPIVFSCYLQPKVSDLGIFSLLREAGCIAIDFGTDSGSPAMLSRLRKPFTGDDIEKVSRACREARIDFCHSLIFGGPGETHKTISETVSLMDEISPKAVIAMTGVRIYPGTEMSRIAVAEGVCEAGQSLLEPKFYFPQMGADELLKTVYQAVEGKKNWFFPGKRDWSSTLGFKVLKFLYRKGPVWRSFRK